MTALTLKPLLFYPPFGFVLFVRSACFVYPPLIDKDYMDSAYKGRPPLKRALCKQKQAMG